MANKQLTGNQMLYRKIIHGYVNQVFNDAGECIVQQFTAGDDVEYETGEGLPINGTDFPLHCYQPFDMVQPLPNLKIEDEVLEALK
jgi:hypothetical protein